MCYLKLERCKVGRREKAQARIRIFPLGLYADRRRDPNVTQEHVAWLRSGAVGPMWATGGQNRKARSPSRADDCDHTRQTLSEENRIPETKGGKREREQHMCSTHCALCRGDNKTQVRRIMDSSRQRASARGKTILQNKRQSDDQQALTVVTTPGTCRQFPRVPRVRPLIVSSAISVGLNNQP